MRAGGEDANEMSFDGLCHTQIPRAPPHVLVHRYSFLLKSCSAINDSRNLQSIEPDTFLHSYKARAHPSGEVFLSATYPF